MKVWGMVLVDKNSGAVHCDVVLNYSAQETLKTLRRFAALCGWPSEISSDLGSQLESSLGEIRIVVPEIKVSSGVSALQTVLGDRGLAR